MMSVKTLLKLNKLFRCPAHPFNAPAEETQQGPDLAYARWEYGRAEAGLLLFAPWYAPGDIVFRKDVLDIGCGAGGCGVYYAEKYGARVTGLELEERYEAQAEALAAERLGARKDSTADPLADPAPGSAGGSFTFLLADAAASGLPPESFDTIIMSDAFEHLKDPEAVLRECRRLLRPGGRVFISFPPYGHPYGEHLSDLIGIPWVQLFFSGADMSAAYARLAAELDEKAGSGKTARPSVSGAQRIAFRFTKDPDGTCRNTYINRMTLKRFRGILERFTTSPDNASSGRGDAPSGAQKPFRLVLYREKPLRGWLLPLAKLPGIKEHFVRMAVCVLEKDANKPGDQ